MQSYTAGGEGVWGGGREVVNQKMLARSSTNIGLQTGGLKQSGLSNLPVAYNQVMPSC